MKMSHHVTLSIVYAVWLKGVSLILEKKDIKEVLAIID